MEGFGASEMQALADLLCPDADEEEGNQSAHPQQTEKYKSKAKPNVKIQAKVVDPKPHALKA